MPEHEIDLTLFVACYNEEANIVNTLDTVVAACMETVPSFEIIIIDDASKDRSVEIILNYIKSHPDIPINVRQNKRNQGLANNYNEAAFAGRGKWYRLNCGDNVEPKETLVEVFNHIGKAEILIPYRSEEVKGRTLARKAISKAYTMLVNGISGYHLHYYNGLTLTRRYYVMRWHSNSHGFGFQADLLTRLLDQGLSHLEIPVRGQERTAGTSNALTFRNFCSVCHTLLNIFIRRVAKILYGYN